MEKGTYLFAHEGTSCIIKPVGRIDFLLGTDLNRFLDEIFTIEDLRNIIIDLSETEYIDSTNLGIMVKIREWLLRRTGRKTAIISTRPEITELLTTLSFDRLFVILDQQTTSPAEYTPLPHEQSGKTELKEVVANAHQYLASLNIKNRLVFRSVLDNLDPPRNSGKSI